jgi:hypothetical protein
MIIVQLLGGLGNQMFQYAAGRRLAHSHHTELYLDITRFASDSLREYGLDIFRIDAKIASPDLLKQVPFSRLDALRIGVKNLHRKKTRFQYIKEQSFDFNKQVLSLPKNIYLEGYRQSEKYFKDIKEILEQEFSIKDEPDRANRELTELINSTESVNLHIRRGDYVSNPTTNEAHGICSLDYYRDALGKLTETVESPHLFIFSDDPEWVRNNVHFPYPSTLVEINGPEKDYEDIRLMSLCNHHIIANSSFSWWGAWLCKYTDKQIYAPRHWFNTYDKDTKDLIPENWHRI